MKKILFVTFLFSILFASAQTTLYNPLKTGSAGRNSVFTKGLQVGANGTSDTLISTGETYLTKLRGSGVGVVSIDNDGKLGFSSGGGSGWSTTGNSGTNSNNNFWGTTDNMGICARTNNIQVFRADTSGNYFAGYGSLINSNSSSVTIASSSATNFGKITQDDVSPVINFCSAINGGILSASNKNNTISNCDVGGNSVLSQMDSLGNYQGSSALAGSILSQQDTSCNINSSVALCGAIMSSGENNKTINNSFASGGSVIGNCNQCFTIGTSVTGQDRRITLGDTIKYPLTSPGTNKVLTSDASGNASWQNTVHSLKDFYTTVQNSGNTLTTLYSDTLLANQLSHDGDKVIASYTLQQTSSVTDILYQIDFGGSTIFNNTFGMSENYVVIMVSFIRASSSTIRYTITGTGYVNGSGTPLESFTTTGIKGSITFSNTQILKLSGQTPAAGTTGDILAFSGYVIYYPYAQ